MLQIQEFNAALFTFKCCKVNVVKKLSRLFSYFFPFFDRRAWKTQFGSRTNFQTEDDYSVTNFLYCLLKYHTASHTTTELYALLTTCCRDIGVFLGYLCAVTRITSTYTATIKTSFTVHSVITANNLQMFEVRLSAWVRIV